MPAGVVAERHSTEILPLTALRGLACWWVVLYHFNDAYPLYWPLTAFIRQGPIAVDLFFVLSGFVLALQYSRGFSNGVNRRTYGLFVGVRLARIYPLHFVVLVLFLMLPLVIALTGRMADPAYNLATFLRNLFLIQQWGFIQPLSWNVPAWSISAEFLFCLFFPCLAYLFSKISRTMVGLLSIPVLLIVLNTLQYWFLSSLSGQVEVGGLYRCFVGCTSGMWVYHVSQRARLSSRASLCMVLLSGIIALLYGLDIVSPASAVPSSFVCLIWGLLNPNHLIGRALSHPVLLWLGRISFSTYLTHFFIRAWLRLMLLHHLPIAVLLLIYLASVVLASMLFYRWVEVPGRRAGRRLAEKWFAPLQPAAPDHLPVQVSHLPKELSV